MFIPLISHELGDRTLTRSDEQAELRSFISTCTQWWFVLLLSLGLLRANSQP